MHTYTKESPFWSAVNVLGRVFIGAFFIWAAIIKLINYEEAVSFMQKDGVPDAFLVLTIALEFCMGAAILLGWRTRIAAFILGVFIVVTNLVFHLNLGEVMGAATFLKNMALSGGLFTLASQYPSMWSLDRLRLEPGVD